MTTPTAGAGPPRRRRWGPPLAAAAALGAARAAAAQSSAAFRCAAPPAQPRQRRAPWRPASPQPRPAEPRSRLSTPRAALARSLASLQRELEKPARRPPTPRKGLGRTLGAIALVSTYISTDVGVFLFTDLSGGGYARPAVMCLSALTSFLLGAGVSLLTRRREGLLEVLDVRLWLRRLPVSGLFCLGTWCTLNAVTRLSPVFVKVLFQLKLPVTVLLSMLLLRRSYSLMQVQALSNAFLAVTAFACLRMGVIGNPLAEGSGLGFAYTACAIFCNVLASLLAERALLKKIPWYTTVAHVKIGEALVSFALLSLVPRAPLPLGELLQSPGSVFAGWSCSVWCLASFLVADAWMSALVVKRLSSVVKALAKSLSMIVLYLGALAVSSESFSLPLFLLAALLTSASQQFAFASRHGGQEDKQAEPPRVTSIATQEAAKGLPKPMPKKSPPKPRPKPNVEKAAFKRFENEGEGPKEEERLKYGLEAVKSANEAFPLAAAVPLAAMGTLGLAFFLVGNALYSPALEDVRVRAASAVASLQTVVGG